MRSYKQVKDVLRQVTLWHNQLLEYCCDGEVPDQEDPMWPLVAYLRKHEESVRAVLDHYAPQEQESVLNTWLQYVPAEQVDEVFSKRSLSEKMTAGEVTEMMMEFDSALVDLYRSLADNAQAPPRVNEMFQNLLSMQEWQQLRNAWSISDSESYANGHNQNSAT